MKEDGLVETAANPDDGRVTQVRLTPRGREMFEQMIEVTSDLFRQSFKGLSQAQIKRLNKLLETLFINLSDE
jgi:DNA-binding MarR family transcriptional regulator